MALKMSQPYKHPKTSVYYFRQHVPTDLRPLLGDKILSWSLRTKDCNEAKLRNAAAVLKQAMIWERHRKRPKPLPHPQIVALSGQFYRSFMATLELEPGEATIWVELQKLLDRVAAAPNGLEKWYGEDADRLLVEEGVVTDEYSRSRLLQELDRALRQAAEQQLKRAEGDYTASGALGFFTDKSRVSASRLALAMRQLFGPSTNPFCRVTNSARSSSFSGLVLPMLRPGSS